MNSAIGKRVLFVAAVMVVFQCSFEINRDWLMKFGNDLVNTSDHNFYTERIQDDSNSSLFAPSEINNFGLTLLYRTVAAITQLQMDRFAFAINIPVLLSAYAVVERIHREATGRLIRPVYVLGLLPLLAYVPLINKDAFGILFYSLLVLVLIRPRAVRSLFTCLLLPLRAQHVTVFATSLLFRLPALTTALRVGILVAVYIVFSAISGYISSSDLLFNGADASGSATGLGSLVRTLNSYGYIGSILLNVTIPFKYMFDLGRSIELSHSMVGMMIMAGRLAATILLVLNVRRFVLLVYCPPYFYERRVLSCLSSVICSFFLTWMMSPIVHYRYLLNIIPLVLAGMSILSIKQEPPAEDATIATPSDAA